MKNYRFVVKQLQKQNAYYFGQNELRLFFKNYNVNDSEHRMSVSLKNAEYERKNDYIVQNQEGVVFINFFKLIQDQSLQDSSFVDYKNQSIDLKSKSSYVLRQKDIYKFINIDIHNDFSHEWSYNMRDGSNSLKKLSIKKDQKIQMSLEQKVGQMVTDLKQVNMTLGQLIVLQELLKYTYPAILGMEGYNSIDSIHFVSQNNF